MNQISLVQIGFNLVFVGLIVYYVWKIVALRNKKAAAETWPVTVAEVVSKYVSKQRGQKGGTSYRPKMTYVYKVIGEEIKHEKFLPGTFWTERAAENAVEALGSTFNVRYNPEKPRDHVSDYDRVSSGDFLMIGFFVFALLAMNYFFML